jgi:hypothetical protein
MQLNAGSLGGMVLVLLVVYLHTIDLMHKVIFERLIHTLGEHSATTRC